MESGLLWAGVLLFAGRFLGDLIKRDPAVLNWAERFSGVLLALGVFALLLRRIYRRQKFLRNLMVARMEPNELKKRVNAGEDVYIVDLAIPLRFLPIRSPCPAPTPFRPRLWPRVAKRFRVIAILCCTAPAPARRLRPKPPCSSISWESSGCVLCEAALMNGSAVAIR